MMWPTVSGTRKLVGAEADLVRRAIEATIERVSTPSDPPPRYGIDWFDQWEPNQQRWLIETISKALLSDQSPPRPAAMLEATVDVIFLETLRAIEHEIDSGETHWRRDVLAAMDSNHRRRRDNGPTIDDVQDNDLAVWRTRVTQLADRILGVPSYQKAEAFRDDDPRELSRFLRQRGLPSDFLEQIPPIHP